MANLTCRDQLSDGRFQASSPMTGAGRYPGGHALAQIATIPQIEVAADAEVVTDVIACESQRHDDTLASVLERAPVVVAADQRIEDLAGRSVAGRP
jgi:hypothetical protein